jgi:hypothetical protein
MGTSVSPCRRVSLRRIRPCPPRQCRHRRPSTRNGHAGRGLHSCTLQLNLNAFAGTGGARRGCVPRMKGMLGGVWGCVGCFFVPDTAQVELKSGRVCAPARGCRTWRRSARGSSRAFHSFTFHLNLSCFVRETTGSYPSKKRT